MVNYKEIKFYAKDFLTWAFALLRLPLLYEEEGRLALPYVPHAQLEALPPASGAHKSILTCIGNQVNPMQLVE